MQNSKIQNASFKPPLLACQNLMLPNCHEQIQSLSKNFIPFTSISPFKKRTKLRQKALF